VEGRRAAAVLGAHAAVRFPRCDSIGPLSAADAYTLVRNGLESSFAPAAEKARHVERLDEVYAAAAG